MPRSAHRLRKAARSGAPALAKGPVIEHSEVVANGLTFSVRRAGPSDGRPVFLLHGFPQTSWCWQAQLEALAAAGYRAIAPDQRGYSAGARPNGIADYTSDHLVADVMALATAMGALSFDLVGHDWGAMVAWLAAAQHPERIRSLTAVSTPHPLALQLALYGGDPQQAKWVDSMESFRQIGVPEKLLLGADGSGSGLRTLLESSGLADEAIETYVAAMKGPGALSAALNWFRATDGDEVEDLPPLMVPTLYVWSTGDAALRRTAAEATALYAVGRYTFVVLDDVSHWIPEVAPDQLNESLLAHLAGT